MRWQDLFEAAAAFFYQDSQFTRSPAFIEYLERLVSLDVQKTEGELARRLQTPLGVDTIRPQAQVLQVRETDSFLFAVLEPQSDVRRPLTGLQLDARLADAEGVGYNKHGSVLLFRHHDAVFLEQVKRVGRLHSLLVRPVPLLEDLNGGP